ncbi:hypothetical protein [Cryobacterium glucosi]|uniref:Tetratricopeptide repeat protein n=1 Tax=Cryobacterium glucosi TaxID=1259175 RepID=A0ABY2IMP4_9MICO|nr:hypothetical protein [Cryobacterium glucosi]TFC19465.1 hypothetical protein E3O46_11910 [Cryobacterium glucosi]
MIRPASGSAGANQDFDAARIFMIDQGTHPDPCAQWSTTSLMTVVGKVARSRPFHDGQIQLKRSVHGTSALAYLAQRGLDPARLVRDGFGRQLQLTIDVSLALMVQSGETVDPVYREWLDLRTSVAGAAAEGDEFALSPAFQTRIRLWSRQASIPDLVDWISPNALEWGLLSDMAESLEPAMEEYSWFTDRFTNTFLSDWAEVSLEYEYRYVIEGWKPAHLPSELLLERQVSPEKVRAELARRFVHGRNSRDSDAIAVLTARALEAIESGNREIAATIFSSARTLDPSDAVLANNHAFCLIPDHPAEALSVLAEARRLGAATLVLEANVATAHLFLGDWLHTLRACDAAVEIGLTLGDEAWLWSIQEGEHNSAVKVDPAIHICSLALQAAAQGGDNASLELWLTRQALVSATAP